MKVLRDKKRLTRFLILYRSAVESPRRLADIASELDMSEQAASNYISDMEEEGLMDRSSGTYHPTSKGMELVRDILEDFGSFLDEASDQIDLISTTTAIASESIREDDEVGLSMKDGLLRASLQEFSSQGTALHDAEKGQPLKVGGLKGITEMEVGKLYLLESDLDSGGEIATVIEELNDKVKDLDFDKVAVMEETQYGLCSMMDLEPDIVFAPVRASINAAEKGLDVLFMLSKDDLDRTIEKLSRRNKGLDEEYCLDYEVI
ncbi:MAG: winged helix-turn-helix domain-containing protein [Candidatus Thermoplasmatota archaeon]